MFQTEVAQKIKTKTYYVLYFFKSCGVRDKVKKTDIAREAMDMNIIRGMRIAHCTTKATDTDSE